MITRTKYALLALTGPLLALLGGGCPDADLSSEKTDSAQSALRVDAVTPNHGATSGGTRVTIRGGPFQSDVGVLFGAHAGIDPVIVNDQMITAIAPAQLAGVVDILVLANGGKVTVLGGYTYDGPEFLADSIEPASGPLEGGVQVTIRGTNIPPDAGVLFGAIAATGVVFVNEQILTAVVPPAPEGGAVNVTLLDNSGQAVIAGTFEYVLEWPEVDDGTDTDGDGMTDVQETTGWEVWTEQFGLGLGVDTFGNVTRYLATSDPNNPDTDHDGLDDKLEFLIRSDPRLTDTDGDGLWDGEEWNQWLTSPTSVDTDADARGDRNVQNAPNQALFDGMEIFDSAALRLPPGHPLRVIKPRATSPTLFDTDADGVGDFDEFDSTVRNGVLADLPRLEYELVGDVDVRLNVEYAETVGQTKEYGVTLTESESTTIASSYSSTFGWSLELSIGAGYEDAAAYWGAEFTAGIHGEYTNTTSKETSRESSRESSRLQSDSREFTETAADGAIRTAIMLRNAGNTTFIVNGLGVLVGQREKQKAPGDTSSQMLRTAIATMTPVFDTITLAPGESAGPFELAATGVNAQAIKELLAAPDTLMLGTTAMNFTDSAGLDFDFVREFTMAQTAYIVIDFGDGEVRHYNVATNVDRNPDSTYRGITMRRALEEVLELPFGNADSGYTTMVSPDDDLQVLQSLVGRRYAQRDGGRDFWTIVTNNPAHTGTNLNDTVLRSGDYVHLMFSRDDDNDGLSNTLEKAAGTDVDPLSPDDADGDGLTDVFEVRTGWIVFEDPANPSAPHPDGFEKHRVLSDARSADADEDGLSDAQEFAARSDPTDPDTDGDSLLDGQDLFPIRRAGIRFVKADATAGGNGRTWATAYTTIQQALSDAAAGQATPSVPDDDVAQIWVARGVYRPANRTTPIQLLNNVAVYGGFSGPGSSFAGETKRGQRLTNAFANGCIITGDLAGNDIGEIDLAAPGTRAENCPQLVVAPAGVNSSAVLDGFMLTGAYNPDSAATGGALATLGSPLIQNCLFFKNGNAGNGAGISVQNGSPVFKKCTLAENAAQFGGGVRVAFATYVVFEDCEFTQNEARLVSSPDAPTGGGIRIANGGRVDLTRCSFTGNKAHNKGAGVWADGAGIYVRIDSCRFYDNLITGPSGANWNGAGAGAFLAADASVSNSVFWGNHAKNWGGGIAAFRRCTITNCTVAFNRTIDGGAGAGIMTATHFGQSGNVTIENTISWANWYGSDPLPDEPAYAEHLDIVRTDGALLSVRNSCFDVPLLYRGNNNIGEDPEFTGLDLGDLRLAEESPCTDRGNSFVDLDPLLPGLQRLPELDFFGNPRIADGNGDGFVSVDMGACEGSAAQ